jgi:hypothetical protein
MNSGKGLLLVAVLASLASASLTLLLSGALRPEAPPPASALSAADFKAALADLESQVAGLRREMAERGASAEPWVASSPAGARVPAPSAAGSTGGADGFRAGSDSEAPAPSAAHLLHFRELFERDEDGDTHIRKDLRRRWMFRGEREVVEWFGIPESIAVEDSGVEDWYYEIPTGEKDEEGEPMSESYQIHLNRGRVIDIND